MDRETRDQFSQLQDSVRSLRERIDRSYTQVVDLIPSDTAHAAATLDADADMLLSLTGQEFGLDTQGANLVFAGPSSGGDAVPTFRTLTVDDVPAGVAPGAHAATHYAGAADPVDHDQLAGFVADEHVDHTAVSITAGDGLTGGGTIEADVALNVGAGDGIAVGVDVVEVALASPSGLSFVSGDLQIDDSIAGNGLTISGKVLAVGAGTLIAVASNSVALSNGAAQGQAIVTGASPYAPAYSLTPTWRGTHTWHAANQINLRDSALRIYSSTDGQLDIDADVELELSAPTIQLIASSRVYVSGGPLDVAGTLEFQGAQSVTTTVDDLTLAPADDLLLDPGGGDVLLSNWAAGYAISSDTYVSQSAGWSINYGTNGGDADFRYVWADELRVQAFVADIYMALIGSLIITKSRGKLSRNFTIPSNGNTGTLYLEDLEGWENTQLFTANDVVRLRYIDSSGGGLVVSDVWGVVTSYRGLSGGEQSYTFTTSDDGGVSGSVVFAGSIALDYGQTGSGSRGVWLATVQDNAGAPYSDVRTWTTNPWTAGNFTTHVRVGNLDGISGIGTEYGLWAGQGTGNEDPQIIISDTSADLRNLNLYVHDGSNTVIRLDYSTPYFSVGEPAPDGYVSGGDGFWVGNDAGTYKLFLGSFDETRLQWDGDDLAIISTTGGTSTSMVASGKDIIFYKDTDAVLTITNDPSIIIGIGHTTSYPFVEITDSQIAMFENVNLMNLLINSSVFKLGTSVEATDYTHLVSFLTSQTYNGESVDQGDFLIGDNSAGKANMLWDRSAGRLNFRGGTTTQAYVDTDGSIMAGGGNVILDSDGISVTQTTAYARDRAYVITDGTDVTGALWGRFVSIVNSNYIELEAKSIAAQSTIMNITADCPSSYTSQIALIAYENSVNQASITMSTAGDGSISLNADDISVFYGRGAVEINGDSADAFIRQSDGAYSVGLFSTALGAGALALWDDNPDSDAPDAKIFLYAKSGEDNWVNNGGNFGLGTATPSNNATLQGRSSESMVVDVYTGDGDATDDNSFVIYGLGTPGSIANRERLLMGWDVSEGYYRIWSDAANTGTLRPINIFTGTNTNQVFLATDGNVGINETSPAISDGVGIHIGGKILRLDTSKSPTSGGTGNVGEICWDGNYIYVCTATNTWKRAALTGGY